MFFFISNALHFLKLQLCAGPNVHAVHCIIRDCSPEDLHTMTLVTIDLEIELT